MGVHFTLGCSVEAQEHEDQEEEEADPVCRKPWVTAAIDEEEARRPESQRRSRCIAEYKPNRGEGMEKPTGEEALLTAPPPKPSWYLTGME